MTTIIALALVLMLTVPSAGASPRVQTLVGIEGTITAVYPGTSTFILRATGSGRTGRDRSGEFVVLVRRITALTRGDGGARFRRSASIADLRVGDHVALAAVRLDDGRLLALRVRVKRRPRESAVIGVVTAKTRNTIAVASSDGGTPRAILILPATAFRGLRSSLAAIRPGDVVTVWGSVNSDGSVAARAVETRQAARPPVPFLR